MPENGSETAKPAARRRKRTQRVRRSRWRCWPWPTRGPQRDGRTHTESWRDGRTHTESGGRLRAAPADDELRDVTTH